MSRRRNGARTSGAQILAAGGPPARTLAAVLRAGRQADTGLNIPALSDRDRARLNDARMRELLKAFVATVYDRTAAMGGSMASSIAKAVEERTVFESTSPTTEFFFTFGNPGDPNYQRGYAVTVSAVYFKAVFGYALACDVYLNGKRSLLFNEVVSMGTYERISSKDEVLDFTDGLNKSEIFWKRFCK